MLEPLEISGFWWLPDNPDQKIAGTLKFSQENGGKLELLGLFDEGRNLIKPPHAPNVILGDSTDGKATTLHECFIINRYFSLTVGSGQSAYLVHFIFQGAHFQAGEDITFKSLTVNYTDLDEWVGMGSIEFDRKGPDISIESHPPDPIKVDLIENLQLIIEVSADTKSARLGREGTIFERAFITMKQLNDEIGYLEFLLQLRIISNLLVLGVGRLVYPTQMTGTSDKAKKEFLSGNPYYIPISIHYQLLEPPIKRDLLFRGDMLFALINIRERLSEFLQNWFTCSRKLSAVHDLYFGSFYTQRLFINHRFLNIIQGLETYHRMRMKNEVLPQEEHKQRVMEILGSVPEKYRNWLGEKLKNANEPSLKIRIEDLVTRYSEIIAPSVIDQKAFIGGIITTRNRLTHHIKNKKAITDTLELYEATITLTILLESALLEELGFTLDEIVQMQRSRRRHPM